MSVNDLLISNRLVRVLSSIRVRRSDYGRVE